MAVVAAVAGLAFGPAGAVVGAFVGPFAVHVARRLRELQARVARAGLDEQEVTERLDADAALAHFVADVVHGVVESDLAAMRGLLAQAAIRVLTDEATVDVEGRFVRAASAIDTADVRVLAIAADPPARPEGEVPARVEGAIYEDEIESRWPGVREILPATIGSLATSGLVERIGIGGGGYGSGPPHWRVTSFGERFLDRLRAEGLEMELRERDEGR